MQEFRKIQTIVIVEEEIRYADGKGIKGFIIQNKGQPDDRWFIDADTFVKTYEETINDYQPSSFLDRLQVECKELVEKKVKLQAFFATPTFPDLTMEEKDLLYEQERLMSRYIQILGKRIILAGSKYKVSDDSIAIDKDGKGLR